MCNAKRYCGIVRRCAKRRLRRAPDERSEVGRSHTNRPAGMLAFRAGFLYGFAGVHRRNLFPRFFAFPKGRREQALALRNLVPFLLCPHVSGAHCRQMHTNLVRLPGSWGGTPLVRGAGAQSPRFAPRQGLGGEDLRSARNRVCEGNEAPQITPAQTRPFSCSAPASRSRRRSAPNRSHR